MLKLLYILTLLKTPGFSDLSLNMFVDSLPSTIDSMYELHSSLFGARERGLIKTVPTIQQFKTVFYEATKMLDNEQEAYIRSLILVTTRKGEVRIQARSLFESKYANHQEAQRQIEKQARERENREKRARDQQQKLRDRETKPRDREHEEYDPDGIWDIRKPPRY